MEMKKLLLMLPGLLFLAFPSFSQTVEFFDDFESGTDSWVLEGAWGTTTAQSYSPSTSLTDSPGGNYLGNQNISAAMATGVDLTDALDAELKFWAIYDIEGGNFDYMYIEASGDGGTTWVNVATFLGEGNLDPWVEYTYSLGGFVGSDDVRVRFRFFSDGGYEVDGMYIDDVQIISSNEDNSAPLILHEPTTFYRSYVGDLTKTADLIDVSGITASSLWYSVDGGPVSSIDGVNTGGDSYEFVIPAQAPGAQVDYFIEASDASANMNNIATPTYSYIDGNHIYYDNEQVDFVNSFGPDAVSGLMGCAVRFTLVGNTDVVYALIRNYTDSNRPNDDFEFHIWANNNGFPGDDLITPFMVTPEANLEITSPMTRIDLSAYMAELSGLTGDVFVGYTVPEGETWLTQTTPNVAGRTYTFDGTFWSLNTGDDYHFRIITSPFDPANECEDAVDLSALMGQGINNPQTSPSWNNSDATTEGDPEEGWECFGEPDGSGSGPSLENTVWYTFIGDGEVYEIRTTDCGGEISDYIDFGDTQMAIYAGSACNDMIPVACNDDIEGTPPEGPYPAGLVLETIAGQQYFMLVDGFAGSDGEFCIQFTQLDNVTCSDISMGASNGQPDVCFGEVTVLSIEDVVIPLTPVSGFLWIVTTEDISGSEDPFNDDSFLGNFALSSEIYAPSLLNDGTQIDAGVHYFTPIVFGGAVDTDGTFAGLDFTNGCIITGNSVEVDLLPELDPLDGIPVSTPDTNPPSGVGTASVDVMGGSGSFSYNWSNGATTPSIENVFAATYTVTISDDSGCLEDLVVDVVVDVMVGTNDPAFERAISLFPNPASDVVNVAFDLEQVSDLEVKMMSVVGQEVLYQKQNAVREGVLSIPVDALSEGVYFMHITDGTYSTVRRLVLSR
ncbi:MAG: T9SS C-terminal target domain-containing protein [Bacteroidetes bacterium]|nr:MAG: T9SS C-terminal target domain-containing protein [Bacteroidota bacterium]